jgi:adenine deaminase
VQVAVRPDSTTIDLIGSAGRDLLALAVEAGFAVRGGLPEDAALAAMTIVPARLLGIDHRVGTLAPGRDCDAIVTDGDILHYQTFVQYAVVDGKVVYDKEKELYFAHIRPRPKPPAAAEPPPEAKAEEKPAAEQEETPKDDEPKAEDEKKPDDKDE